MAAAQLGSTASPKGMGAGLGVLSKDGPAERAGLRVGDLLLRLNPCDSASATEQIAKNPPGAKIALPFQRGTEHRQAVITVEDQLAVALRGAALVDPTAEEALGSIYRSGVGVLKNPCRGPQLAAQGCRSGL